MKYLLLLLTIGFFTSHELAAQPPSKMFYAGKVERFRKMKSGGITLAVAGGVLTTVGIVSLANTEWQQNPYSYGYPSNQYQTSDTKAVLGILGVGFGIPAMAGGIVLGVIGSRKMKQYQQKLQDFSFNFQYTPRYHGCVVAYRF